MALFAFSAHAQSETDSTSLKIEAQIEVKEAKMDSTTQKLDSLIINKQAHLDSLQDKTEMVLQKSEDVTQKVNSLTDSITPDLSRVNRKLDSLKQKLTLRIDSLNRIGQPSKKYTQLQDSLNQLGPFKQIDKAEEKITSIQNRISEPANKAGNALNEKLAIMNKEGGSEAGIPGQVNIPGVSAPGINTPAVPGASLPGGINANTPDPLGNVGLPSDDGIGVSDPLEGAGPLPNLDPGKIGELEELEKVQGSLGKVSEVTGQVKGVGDELTNLKNEGIGGMESAPRAVEGQLTKIEEVQGIQKEMGGVEEMKEMAGKGNDPEAMKEMAAKEVKKKAVDHFAGKGEQLQNAMQKVSSMKQKYSSIKSIKDLQKRPPNPMKGKALVERLVPGLVMQFQASEHFLLDFNPVIGYRFGGRVNAGLGWNHRFAIGNRLEIFPEERIYGPRVYGEYKFGKGFAVRADIEKMNTFIPPLGFIGPATEGKRDWVWSAFVGLKKEYKLSKKVNGNFQFLYNLYDDNDNSPYADRLVVRTGFEFPQKRKVKKKSK